MPSLRVDSRHKHVIGYPSAYLPADAQSTVQANTCIGYPYPASPPLAPDRSPNHARSLNTNRNCRCVIIFLLSCLFLFAAVSFITWLFIRPQLPEFRIYSATIPPSNISAVFGIPPHWEISFWVKNPNKKMSIIYGDTEAGLFYGDEELCETAIHAFKQPKGTEMSFGTEFNKVNVTVASRIQEDVKRRTISLDVEMLVWISFESSIFSTGVHLMSISCADVRVRLDNITGVGNWAGGDELCQTDFVR